MEPLNFIVSDDGHPRDHNRTMIVMNKRNLLRKLLLLPVLLAWFGSSAHGFYDASVGRWINRDPLGELGFDMMRLGRSEVWGDGPNLYVFVENAPVNIFDPTGEAGAIAIGGGVGTAICPGVGTVIGIGVGVIVTGIIIVCVADHADSPPKCKSEREKCRDAADAQGDADSDACRGLKGKAAQRKCLHDAFDKYARALAECNKLPK